MSTPKTSKAKPATSKKFTTGVDKRQELVDQLIKKMEEAVKYETPWFQCNEMPFNPETGTQYRGINVVSLMMAGYSDPRFYTFKGMQDAAAKSGLELHLKQGSKGLPVFKAIQVPRNSPEAKAVGEGEDSKDPQMIWIQKCAGVVFNASQIEGLPPYERQLNTQFTPIEEAELVKDAMVEKSGLKVEHHTQGKAFYMPSQDKVMLPEPEQFKSTEMYYRTMMHELGHATGHESRLDRTMKGNFGDEKYAFEELVAELTSYFTGAEIGLPYDAKTHENHAAYVKSWIGALKDDKTFIFKAAAHANKATDFQMDLQHELKQERMHITLVSAVRAHDIPAVDQILAKGAFINQPDEFGNIALHHAAELGDLNMTAHLIEKGADIMKMNHESISPEDLAVRGRHMHVATLFQQALCGEGYEVAQAPIGRKQAPAQMTTEKPVAQAQDPSAQVKAPPSMTRPVVAVENTEPARARGGYER